MMVRQSRRFNDGKSMKQEADQHLLRRFGLLQATALNMSNMIGIGPFITIPLLMSALNGGGPQAMLGWIVAVVISLADGMVWSELGAAMPGSGGSYVYLCEAFRRETFGRFMAFLFIWQFILSGPLEIASGYIGFANYLNYLWPGMTTKNALSLKGSLVVAGLGLLCIALLYRRITFIGKITVALWVGSILTTVAVIFTGVTHFDSRLAFDFPKGAFHFSTGFLFGLGAASRIGVYDYLGYYDICYIGDEVKEPGKVIPRSILLSIVGVARICARGGEPQRKLCGVAVHGEDLWQDHRVDLHRDGPLDGVRIVLRAAAWLFADSVRGGAGRRFFQSLRTVAPQASRPYRMWLYPLPALVALAGWIFIFVTSDPKFILYGLGTVALGVVFFLGWSWHIRRWPFVSPEGGHALGTKTDQQR